MVGVSQLAFCDNVEGTRKECSTEYLLDRIDCANSIQPQHAQKSSGLPLSRQTESIDPLRGRLSPNHLLRLAPAAHSPWLRPLRRGSWTGNREREGSLALSALLAWA